MGIKRRSTTTYTTTKNMKNILALILLPLVCCVPIEKTNLKTENDINLVTFDGTESTTFQFIELDDPVMGGVSSGTFEVNEIEGYGIHNGTVRDVPSLSAPGVIAAFAEGDFNDISSAISGYLVLRVRSPVPEYNGFRISFAAGAINARYSCSGGGQIPFSRGCYKARFQVPAGHEFSEVAVPFSNFSDLWSPSTGDQTVTCSEDTSVCPTEKELAKIQDIQIWAEGVNGEIHLEIESISARIA